MICNSNLLTAFLHDVVSPYSCCIYNNKETQLLKSHTRSSDPLKCDEASGKKPFRDFREDPKCTSESLCY